jgi:TrmH family RNA methyltransferase
MNTSLSKGQIQFIKELRQKEGRKLNGLFIVEGEKMLDELLATGLTIQTIYHTVEYALSLQLKPQNTIQISQKDLDRISLLKTPNKVLATVFIPPHVAVSSHKVIYCCNIQDPGNTGTILRIADWYGVKDVLFSSGSVDVYAPKVVQSTMGSIFRINCTYDDNLKELKHLKDEGYAVYGADMQGVNLDKVDFSEKSVLVMGSESHGIPHELRAIIDTFVTIPKKGLSESLNVGVACGIICQKMIFN